MQEMVQQQVCKKLYTVVLYVLTEITGLTELASDHSLNLLPTQIYVG